MLQINKCPVCRLRMSGEESSDTPCARCGSDLSNLRTLYQHVQHFLKQARFALRRGQVDGAVSAALKAIKLVDHPETRATLAAALYMKRSNCVSSRQSQTPRAPIGLKRL